MSYLDNQTAFESPYFDLHEGHVHALARVRQIRAYIQDQRLKELRPLTIVTLVTCLEWFARPRLDRWRQYHH